MRSKEQEPETPKVFFRSLFSWHLIPLKMATGCFAELDLRDYEDLAEVWIRGPGRATISSEVARITKTDPVLIRYLPPGSYVSFDGKIVSKK